MAERRGSPRLRVGLLGAGILLAAAGVWLLVTAPESTLPDDGDASQALQAIATHRVESRELRPHTRVASVLEPRRSVELFSETAGRVVETGADELDRVSADQPLVRLDPLLARVAVERARAALARSESQLALAKRNLERRRSLAQRDATSAAVLDAAENEARVAEAGLREARATLTEARDRLAKKTIAAPFDGVLRSFPVQVGETLQEGQRIAELLDLTAVRLLVGLADREIVEIGAGAEAEVEVEAHPGETFRGRVLRAAAAADPITKKFPVEIEVPNPDGRLLPGMVARVSLALGAPRSFTLIPREATLADYGMRFVFVLEQNGSAAGWHVRRRRVEVRELPFRPQALEVLSGLAPGEEIALTGLRTLRDGLAVRRAGGDSP